MEINPKQDDLREFGTYVNVSGLRYPFRCANPIKILRHPVSPPSATFLNT
jgi:hypothetical protein